MQNINKQLAKTGDTIFECSEIKIEFEKTWFIPISILNQLRRDVLDALENAIIEAYIPEKILIKKSNHSFSVEKIDYQTNVANKLAKSFYERHGVKAIEDAFEIALKEGAHLMTTRYCLFNELSLCPKETGKPIKPIYLKNREHKLTLTTDCKNCQMIVTTDLSPLLSKKNRI